MRLNQNPAFFGSIGRAAAMQGRPSMPVMSPNTPPTLQVPGNMQPPMIRVPEDMEPPMIRVPENMEPPMLQLPPAGARLPQIHLLAQPVLVGLGGGPALRGLPLQLELPLLLGPPFLLLAALLLGPALLINLALLRLPLG